MLFRSLRRFQTALLARRPTSETTQLQGTRTLRRPAIPYAPKVSHTPHTHTHDATVSERLRATHERGRGGECATLLSIIGLLFVRHPPCPPQTQRTVIGPLLFLYPTPSVRGVVSTSPITARAWTGGDRGGEGREREREGIYLEADKCVFWCAIAVGCGRRVLY